jgi:hypothetical protein
MSAAVTPQKRSRWLDWQPKTRIISGCVLTEPTKPTKRGFVGFVGSTSSESPIIEDSPGEGFCWPAAAADFGRRFGQPHAKLFPYLGRKVRTPGGPGTLLQVFVDRVTVVLDSELSSCSFYAPRDIEPISWKLEE